MGPKKANMSKIVGINLNRINKQNSNNSVNKNYE